MESASLKGAVVAGGSGLVGRLLVTALLDHGARVTVLSRRPESVSLPPGAAARDWEDLPAVLRGADAVFNLAGEGIADRRWTPTRKAALRDSRSLPTRRLVAALAECALPPPVLVNASAVGYYGSRDAAPADEETPAGTGFLAETCAAWEEEARGAEALGIRVVRMRLGVVLAEEGGALPKMAGAVRWFQGCRLGSGQQGFSWIHRNDLVALLLEAARNPGWRGAFNAVAPQPLAQAAFMRLLARSLHRPLLPVPGTISAALLRVALGERADELLLRGVFAVPSRALAQGFRFRFPTALSALEDLL
ncbi:TIGR01777 family oxidoreductase [Geothrix sp. 21YS21S-4]|uniref:TIGR01777 family oxidoreductase n=1 Tax=Geothrix sp. 21YS21S-4 TaxID=3068889 RepID=UPI0027BA7AFD|nr:TIGR01777 family oxidoreductase [Geothrix sp. 21YS21S-4]